MTIIGVKWLMLEVLRTMQDDLECYQITFRFQRFCNVNTNNPRKFSILQHISSAHHVFYQSMFPPGGTIVGYLLMDIYVLALHCSLLLVSSSCSVNYRSTQSSAQSQITSLLHLHPNQRAEFGLMAGGNNAKMRKYNIKPPPYSMMPKGWVKAFRRAAKAKDEPKKRPHRIPNHHRSALGQNRPHRCRRRQWRKGPLLLRSTNCMRLLCQQSKHVQWIISGF